MGLVDVRDNRERRSCRFRRATQLPMVLILMSIILVHIVALQTANAQTVVGTLTLTGGEDILSTAVIDTANGFAYFGTGTVPGKIVKVRLSDFTRVGALTLDRGEGPLTSSVIDSANGFAKKAPRSSAKDT